MMELSHESGRPVFRAGAAALELFAIPPGAMVTILLDEAEIDEVKAQLQRKLLGWGAPEEHAREWSQVGIAFRARHLLLLGDAVRFPDGSPGTYMRFVDGETACQASPIPPIHQGQALLSGHFRACHAGVAA
jgi:ADP-ribose pyrophosphatase